MFTFLLVVHVIIAVALVGVILMQRSEGGGLTGGSPAGLMSARGAADFLTRATTILATLFITVSIALAGLATMNRAPTEIDTSLARQPSVAPAGDTNATAPIETPVPVTSAVPLAVPSTPADKVATPAPKPVVSKPKAVVEKPATSPAKPVIAPKPVETVVPSGLIPDAKPN
jgi:preprotein translocase subunit SecG